jgi:segregation and condensation protein B
VFGLSSLRDLPDIEKLEDAGLLARPVGGHEVDIVIGLREDGDQVEEE